ncbi:TnsA-like heteromeric transposase endonuclease subunit [Streptomyces sp. NPDC017979]|uniref:TnsA-like heteromeric transposase endonuclease subunit n=1 Tax=Streptomyces sp. NPDC017979 TaxID=3365024 RepID=UPI0037B10769
MDLAGPYVELSYVDAVRKRRRRPLLDCVTARFEDAAPVRPFRWSRGERHFAGWYWAATTGQHVGFEPWLERDRLLLIDFDSEALGIAWQHFWLHWHDGERERRHAPDYFVRRTDGSAVVRPYSDLGKAHGRAGYLNLLRRHQALRSGPDTAARTATFVSSNLVRPGHRLPAD